MENKNDLQKGKLNAVRVAIEILIAEARIAHAAPDAHASEFKFGMRPDGQGVDAFRNWTGVTLPFNKAGE